MDFNTLSPESRIWIYQSSRKFTPEETQNIRIEANKFAINWISHNKDLEAAAEIFYDQFLILAVDEGIHQASGCSIDSSIKFIHRIENMYNLDLLNRENIAFFIKDMIKLISIKDIRIHVKNGIINSPTMFFNNLITIKSDLDSKWFIPVSESWVSRYL